MRTRLFLKLGLAFTTPIVLTIACGDSDPLGVPAGTGGASSASGGTAGMPDGNMGGQPNKKPEEDISGVGAEGGMRSMGGATGMGGTMVTAPSFEGELPCVSDKQCTTDGLLCNPELYVCVECFEDSECGDEATCQAGSCVALEAAQTCENSLGCSTDEVCVKSNGEELGVCQECGGDADCTDGGTCVAGSCRASCESDKQCTSSGLLCDDATGSCTECVTTADCDGANVCSMGDCVASVCEPGRSQCLDNAVVTCRQDGHGYLSPADCGEATCTLTDEEASCFFEGDDSKPQSDSPVLFQNFSRGTERWSVSGTEQPGAPQLEGGAACISLPGFTFGWPAEGEGFELAQGSYQLSFRTRGPSAGLEAKVAAAQEPWQPVYFSRDVDLTNAERHSFTFEVEEAGEDVGLAFNVWNNEGTLCFDDIELSAN